MANKLEYRSTPKEYKPQEVFPGVARPTAKQPGRIERVDYTTSGQPKHAYVYLPHGYDPSKKYDILYLMHGGGDRADKFLGTDDTENEFKGTLDHMIENGDIRPVIVVSPSYYPMDVSLGGPGSAGELVEIFHGEFIDDLVPAVEGRYSTYAASTDRAGIKASRDHRAFGGFSMGACTTWWQFIHGLDYVATFLPLSGDCWALGQRAGADKPKETAEFLAGAVRKSGRTKNDFRIFAATGTKDIAFDALDPQLAEMKKLTDVFDFGETADAGNLHYILAPDLEHQWGPIWDYCYDIMLAIYPKN